MSLRNLIIAGLCIFLAGVVALFPARVAYSWFAVAPLRLSGIEGTVWSGSAREGQVDALYFRDLEWTVTPLSLLRGVLGIDISLNPAGGFLESRIEASLSGAVLLTDLSAGVPLGALRTIVPLAGVSGNLRIQIDRLAIANGLPTGAEGTVEVVSLTSTMLSRSPIGSYRVTFTDSGEGIAGSIEDIDGVFDIAGSIRLDSARNYELRGLIVPTPEAPAEVVRQLQILGSPNARGQREFRLEGSL